MPEYKYTPEQLAEIEEYEVIFGKGNQAVEDYKSILRGEVEPVSVEAKPAEYTRPIITETDVAKSAAKAVQEESKRRLPDLQQQFMDEGLSSEDAFRKAQRAAEAESKQEVAASLEQPRTVMGKKREGIRYDRPIEEMSLWELFNVSIGPKTIATSKQATEQEERKRSVQEQREEFDVNLRTELLRELGPLDSPEKSAEFQAELKNRTSQYLGGALQNYLKEAYNDYTAETGRLETEFTPNERTELNKKAQTSHKQMVRTFFPEYKTGVYTAPEEVEDKPLWKFLTIEKDEPIGEQVLERGGDILKSYAPYMSEDVGEGTVIETPAGTAMRNVGGFIRPAFEAAMRNFAYDVDAEGNPLDENDKNYILSKEYDEMLADWESGDVLRADSRSRIEEILIAGGAILSAKADRTDVDSYEEPFLSSGNFVRDVLVANIQARNFGDDLMDLPATQTMFEKHTGYEDAAWWAGLGIEVLMPVTPAPIVKPFVGTLASGAAKVGSTARIAKEGLDIISDASRYTAPVTESSPSAARAAANALSIIGSGEAPSAARAALKAIQTPSAARAAVRTGLTGVEKVSNTAAIVGRVMTEPIQMARNFMATSVLRNAQKELLVAGGALKRGKVSYFDVLNPRARDVASMRLVDDFFKSIDANPNLLNGMANSKNPIAKALIDQYSQVGKSLDDLVYASSRGYDEVIKLLNSGRLSDDVVSAYVHAMSPEYYNELAKALNAGNLDDLAGIRKALGYDKVLQGTLNPDGLEAAARTLMKERILETLGEFIPNDLVFVTPTMLATKELFEQNKAALQKASKEMLALKEGEGFLFKNSKQVLNDFIREIGPKNIRDSQVMSRIVQKMAEGKALNSGEYVLVHGTVLNRITKSVMPGSYTPKLSGKAMERAAVPAGRRLEVFRGAQDLARVPGAVLENVLSGKEVFRGATNRISAAQKWIGNMGFKKTPFTSPQILSLKNKMQAVFSNSLEGLKKEFNIARAEVGKKNALNEVFNKYAKGSKQETYKSIIKIFFDNPESGIMVSDVIFNRAWNRAVALGDISSGALSSSEITALIKTVREVESKFERAGLTGFFGRTLGGDEVSSAIIAGILRNKRAAEAKAVIKAWAQENPDQVIKFSASTPGATTDAISSIRGDLLDDWLLETFSSGNKTVEGFVEHGVDFVWSKASQAERANIVKEFLADYTSKATYMPEAFAGQFGDEFVNAMVENIHYTRFHMPDLGIAGEFERAAAALRSHMNASIEPYAREIQRSLVRQGFIARQGESVSGKTPNILRLDEVLPMNAQIMDKSFVALLTDDSTKKVLNEFINAAETGALKENLEFLRARGLLPVITESVKTLNRAAVGGLLGGFPAPNFKFHGNNIFSYAPIAMVTAPEMTMRALVSMPESIAAITSGLAEAMPNRVMTGINDWLRDLSSVGDLYLRSVDDSTVMFEDVYGKVYTKGMLDELMAANELGMSQATFEFGQRSIEELQRAAGTKASGEEAGKIRQMARYMRPDDKNIWNIWAEEADLVARRNVFLTGIKRGMPAGEAAELARRVLLNYGDMSKYDAPASRYVMFYAFQRKMAEDVLTSLLRPAAGRNMVRQIRATQALHKQAGSLWVENDWVKARMWTKYSELTNDERYKTLMAGQQMPALEGFILASNLFDWVANGWLQSVLTGDAFKETEPGVDVRVVSARKAEAFVEGFVVDKLITTPTLRYIFELFNNPYKYKAEGAPHGYVPSRDVLAFQQSGYWDWAKTLFHLERIEPDRMIAGEPTFDGSQWRFSDSASRVSYKTFMYGTLMAGIQRNLKDYTHLWASISGTQDMELKRLGDGNWVLQSVALEGTFKVADEYAIQADLLHQMNKEARGMQQ